MAQYNEVEFFGQKLISVKGDTVTPETLLEGQTAHDAAGTPITGEFAVNPLTAEENGTFTPPAGSAYGPVTVAVPGMPLNPLEATENGTYTPPAGTGYGTVTVAVPGTDTDDATAQSSDIVAGQTAYARGDKLTGTLQDLDSIAFGDGVTPPARGYSAGENYQDIAEAIDALDAASVAVTPLVATENGTYQEEGAAYSPVVVNIDTRGQEILVTAPAGSTVAASRNGVSYPGTESETAPGNYTISVPDYGAYTVTAVLGEDSAVGSAVLEPVTVELSYAPPVYGVSWDGSSSSKMVRTDAAAEFTDPVPYVAGATEYGSPFDSIYPWSGMAKEERSEGTMVKIPKFWYKLEQVGTYGVSIQISGEALDGYSVCPACVDRGDGRGERDYIYVGRYHCAASTYKSTTGALPQVSKSKATFRTSCAALGTNVWMMDFAARFTIWLLYAVEFADWNSQDCIGQGCLTSFTAMGYTDSMPYHTGTDQETRTTYGGTQYRYIEGLWDNCFDLLGSCYNDANGLNIIKNPASDNENSSGGVLVGLPVGGCIAGWTVSDSGPFPCFINGSSTGGSGSAYVCDYWSFSASNPVLCVGSDYVHSQYRGMFCVNYTSVLNSDGSHGSRLMELP